MPHKMAPAISKHVESQFTFRFVGQAYRLLLFSVTAASVSFALQLLALNGGTLTSQATDPSAASVSNSSDATTTRAVTVPAPDKSGQLVNVKDYGATGDGVTNDTAAFNKALASLATAAGGRCLVPKGTYLISAVTNPAIASHVSSNVHLVGEAHGASILKIAGRPAGNFLFCSGENWSVENLTIDMQDYFIEGPGFAAIVATGNNWRITKCTITKMGRVGINIKAGANGSIEGNLITKTVASPVLNSAILGVVDGGGHLPINMHIVDNVCLNSLIYFNGRDSVIAGNRVSGSRIGTNICTGVYSDNVSVINNICSGGRGRDENKCVVSGFELWAPNSVIANNISYDNDGPGITMGGNNCIVIGNRCWNNARLTGVVGGSGIVARAHPRLPNAASGSVFIANSCFDTRPRSAMTQAYGYNEVGNGFKDIKQYGNDYNRNRVGPAKLQAQGEFAEHLQVSTEIKNRLRGLADDADLPDTTRRAARQYLAQ